jgi:CheY-like chemotaxis protein
VKGDLALKKQVLTANLGAGSRLVMGDSARLQQVFWNLLKNAVKFTPEGGRIAVSCEADPKDGTIAVSISDTGIGMEAHEISRFFEAFAQGERSGRAHRFGGLGLGLAISLKLVELHGGSIGAESRGAGKGSTFTVRLPVLADSAQSPDSASGSVSPGGGSREPFAKARRILLVEDHEATRASLAVLLARRGYEVEAVGTVKGAIDAAARGGFDLILSDIGLPDGDGVTLMRDLNKARGLPAIAITGYGMPSDVARSRDAGFLAHITKPISVDVLDRALERRFGPVSK